MYKNPNINNGKRFFKRTGCVPIILILVFFIYVNNAGAQLYVDSNANLFVHTDTLMISANVLNRGNFGSAKGSTILFSGLQWTNDSIATLPDENSYSAGNQFPSGFNGIGGVFWFSDVYSANQTQLLIGGFNVAARRGSSFPNLFVNNSSNILLAAQSDLFIRNEFGFLTGKVWLNNNNVLVGTSSSGKISGYSKDNYFITGTGVNGGYLYRSKIDTLFGKVVFPIGVDISHYSPLAIKNYGAPEDFHARVFNGIYSNAYSGSLGNPRFVQLTWNVGKESAGTGDADIYIQHTRNVEGSLYTPRDNSFITRYDSVNRYWDTIQASPPLVPGTLTTGGAEDSSYENIRNLIFEWNTNEYLSKTVNEIRPDTGKIALFKNLDSINLKQDGTYDLKFSFIVYNKSGLNIDTVQVSDNFNSVFPSTISFNINSVSSTGRLSVNPNYNGLSNGDTLLLNPYTSSIIPYSSDTITLQVNVNLNSFNNGTKTFYNSAYASAVSFGNNNKLRASSIDGVDTSKSYIGAYPTPIHLESYGIHIPSGFSPNNDGINDKFVIGYANNYTYTLEVYNRWGSKVYDSRGNYNNDWDGKSNEPGIVVNSDSGLPDGTYFYVIRFKNKVTGDAFKRIGPLTIKR